MPALEDYLTKQIYIEKNVVTYRSLSRQLGIHVNQAKTELAKFHEQAADQTTRSSATYLVSGELFPAPRTKKEDSSDQRDDGMDVDLESTDDEEVSTTTVTLVGEKDLEDAKSRYARIFSIHVYCLSPSPLTDAGLICGPSAVVYKADAKDAPTSSIVLGRVVGPDVRIGKASHPVASSSKTAEPISRKPTLKVKAEKGEEPEESPPANSTPVPISSTEKEKSGSVKPKASGKLDWSRAKKTPDSDKTKDKESKITVKKEESTSPVEKTAKQTSRLELRDDSPKDESKVRRSCGVGNCFRAECDSDVQRGVKRKAAPPSAGSDAEEKPKSSEKGKDTPTPSRASSDIKLRKNRILSDDEDEAPSPAPRKVNGKTRGSATLPSDVLESDAEKSLRAMMDIDDSLVEKASASRPPPAKPQPVEDEDVEMAPEVEPEPEPQEAEEAPKPKPKKKKEKKVIPVGRNGLKKKRVVKSRMTVDAKGYMVTEDYSSYESVDEEEAAEEEPKKGKSKKASPAVSTAKAKKSPSEEADASDEETPAKGKPIARAPSTTKSKKSSAKAGARGNLKDFFGKPKK
ncbi:DNA polymerase subunit Cdc27 [Trametes punicea]|nr:DNA polymerase subunit Cdc27 [Trametes punicea]